jgi:hypothetical protein
MSTSTLRDKLIEEIEQIPETRLGDVFDLVRAFRMGLDEQGDNVEQIMSVAGSWVEMPEEEYRSFCEELENRRHAAGIGRRSAAGLD